MALYRSGTTWWVRFTTPDGKRVRESARTEDKVAAQEYHDRLKAEYWRVKKLGDKPHRTWKEAVVRWVEESVHKASQQDEVLILRWLDPHLGGRCLDEISRERVDEIARTRKAGGVGNITVNHTIQVIRVILRKAEREWGWMDRPLPCASCRCPSGGSAG